MNGQQIFNKWIRILITSLFVSIFFLLFIQTTIFASLKTTVWTTKEDFENNASTIGLPTIKSLEIDSTTDPGSISLGFGAIAPPVNEWAVTNNPTDNYADKAYGIAADNSGIYIVGHDKNSTGGNRWRVEKRALGDGSLMWAYSDETETIARAAAVTTDASGVYVVGESLIDNNYQWRIEKRRLDNGNLLWNEYSNPSSLGDTPTSVAIDSSGIYVAGYDFPDGSFFPRLRLEKHDLNNGDEIWSKTTEGYSIVTGISVFNNMVMLTGVAYNLSDGYWFSSGFTSNGEGGGLSILSNPSPRIDYPSGLTIDSLGRTFIAGYDSVIPNDSQWRIQGPGWVQNTNPSPSADSATAISTGSSGVYITGYDFSVGKAQWRTEKRDLASGNLLWTKLSNPSSGEDIPNAITNQGNNIYVAGYDEINDDFQWRIEKYKELPYYSSGTIGGTLPNLVGLRLDAGASNKADWKQLNFQGNISESNSIKFAVRTSDDGVVWSSLKGRDGGDINWNENYFGQIFGSLKYSNIPENVLTLPSSRFIDIVVRLESDGSNTPTLNDVSLSYELIEQSSPEPEPAPAPTEPPPTSKPAPQPVPSPTINPVNILNTNLSLSSKPKVVRAGKAVILKGQLKDSSGKGAADKSVVIKQKALKKIKKKVKGKIKIINKWIWKTIARAKTDSKGNFSKRLRPKATAIYKAEYAGDGSYKAANSNAVKITVRKARKKK